MLGPLKHMLKKEFIQTFRDPRMRAVLVVVPIFQVLVFGYAAVTDIRNVRTAVFDGDHSPRSRELVARFGGSGYFDLRHHPSTDAEVRSLLDRGAAQMVLRVNPGFGADIGAGRTAKVQLLLDGTDSNTAVLILSYAGRVVAAYGDEIFAARAGRAGQPPPVTLESRAWFNENLESRPFFVPGVIALLVMVITLMLSAMAIVREKEIGTIEQIMVTPMTRGQFILGKTIPFILIGYMNVLIITLVAVFWFDVPIRGSLLTLLLATGLYLMSMLGLGLFISTVSRTQQQAMMTTFFFAMPFILLSGFIYPIANMPEAVQWLTYLNPLRYFLVIIRGVFLKGIGISILWPQLLALCLLGATLLALATRRFRKTMG
jgi:ABC-2 type transport system permease protein